MNRFIFLSPLVLFSMAFAQEVDVSKSPKASPDQQASSSWMRGDSPLSGAPLTSTVPAAYSYPANITVNGGWDIFADVSYLYWYSKQEGFNLGSLGYDFESSAWFPAASGKVFSQEGRYTSGFKAGLGSNLNEDDWVVDLTYTYLRQNTSTKTGEATGLLGQIPVFNITSWYPLTWYGGQTVASSVTSKWKMGLDWVDLQFSRPSYQGRKLIVTSSGGLRGGWIRQQLHLTALDAFNTYIGADIPTTVKGSNYSNSWGIGPRGVLGCSWLIWEGLRVQGSMGGSLLFTQYTKISTRTTDIYASTITGFLGGTKVHVTDYNCLRPMAEANLGIGWGKYFSKNRYHVDLSATYDFNYLWSQNMIQNQWNESAVYGNNGTPGDMLLHGLDVKARFDF